MEFEDFAEFGEDQVEQRRQKKWSDFLIWADGLIAQMDRESDSIAAALKSIWPPSQVEGFLLERLVSNRRFMQAVKAAYRFGEVPFGWTLADKGHLIEVEAEQLVLRRIRECRNAGVPLERISDILSGNRATNGEDHG